MEILKPYRDRIDALDDQIIDLLTARIGIIHEVAAIKAEHGIAPVLQDRVDEVIGRVAARAQEKGIDPALARTLYNYLVDYACNLEADLIKKTK
jgi:chorismate mutase